METRPAVMPAYLGVPTSAPRGSGQPFTPGGPRTGLRGEAGTPARASSVGSSTGNQAEALQAGVALGLTAAAQGPARDPCQDGRAPWPLGLTRHPGPLPHPPSYSPVLAFMVAGTLCWEVMMAEIPTPYSVPGTRSIGRCRNQRYSLCVSRAGRQGREANDRRLPLGPCVRSFLSPPNVTG